MSGTCSTIGDAIRRSARKSVAAGLKLPVIVRSVAGVVFILLGGLGFLPILGFWMIPAGAVLVALDIPPLRRRVVQRLGRDRERLSDDS